MHLLYDHLIPSSHAPVTPHSDLQGTSFPVKVPDPRPVRPHTSAVRRNPRPPFSMSSVLLVAQTSARQRIRLTPHHQRFKFPIESHRIPSLARTRRKSVPHPTRNQPQEWPTTSTALSKSDILTISKWSVKKQLPTSPDRFRIVLRRKSRPIAPPPRYPRHAFHQRLVPRLP